MTKKKHNLRLGRIFVFVVSWQQHTPESRLNGQRRQRAILPVFLDHSQQSESRFPPH